MSAMLTNITYVKSLIDNAKHIYDNRDTYSDEVVLMHDQLRMAEVGCLYSIAKSLSDLADIERNKNI